MKKSGVHGGGWEGDGGSWEGRGKRQGGREWVVISTKNLETMV